jgi:ribosomal protein S18 acetylase RimI-like enzyme
MYSLRPATDDDFGFLHELFVATMQSSIIEFWGTWDQDRWDTFFREHFNASLYQIVLVGGQAVGALSVERRTHEIYLDTVEIDPNYQGRGLGTALIRTVLADAFTHHLPVTLQVNRANRSRDLYQRLGFTETGRTDTHILMRASPHDTER